MIDVAEDQFLSAFTRGLAGDTDELEMWWPDPERGAAGLSVYRNTILKGLTDALTAQFPSVLAVVGVEWMAAATRIHAQDHPPTKASLADYGAEFPDWLADFEPTAEMPYLADLARLDRMWTLVHLAADSQSLDPMQFAALGHDAFETTVATLSPSLQFAGFQNGVSDLWQALRSETVPEAASLSDAPQAVAFHRPSGVVEVLPLNASGLAFLEACRHELSLAEAAGLALAADPQADLGLIFSSFIAAGFFSALTPVKPKD